MRWGPFLFKSRPDKKVQVGEEMGELDQTPLSPRPTFTTAFARNIGAPLHRHPHEELPPFSPSSSVSTSIFWNHKLSSPQVGQIGTSGRVFFTTMTTLEKECSQSEHSHQTRAFSCSGEFASSSINGIDLIQENGTKYYKYVTPIPNHRCLLVTNVLLRVFSLLNPIQLPCSGS